MLTQPVAALYFDENSDGLCVGVALMEAYGVKGWVCEIGADRSHPYGVVDRALHLLFVVGSRRVVVGASTRRCYDEVSRNFTPFECEYTEERFDADAQNVLFRDLFALSSLLTPIEHLSLENRPLCAQALAFLARKLQGSFPPALPRVLEVRELMELGNNALEQLEMSTADPHHSSIGKLLLTMVTPMGKRLGRFRLFMPIRDGAELERRYDLVSRLSPHAGALLERLGEIGDLEMAWWRLRHAPVGEAEFEALVCGAGAAVQIQEYCVRHRLPVGFEKSLGEWLGEARHQAHRRQWIEEQTPFFRSVVEWIARIDVAAASAMNAQRYALARPSIVSAEGNFLQLMGVRHLLVEEQGVAYVPNDIVMGEREYLDLPYPSTVMLDPRVHDGATVKGVLLYGINSSGKSSLMKSIGIAAVLAQAGFFVPAKSMKFSLFDGVYTRILSRDNVAKSLSTFGVEMLELNTIFSRATSRSLVLGDEISHGTETLSAVAIVASTILEFSRRGVLFLMTTHLHQLSMIPELSRLREVVSLHLSVRYDEKSDRLLYDRLLKPGRGSSVYGLEFAESLHMQPHFLEGARSIRDHLAREYDLLELAHQKEYIKRYREISACECVVCGTLIRNPQARPVSGKHHNLIPLCGRHRREIAEGKIKPTGLIMTPQGLRLEYETQFL